MNLTQLKYKDYIWKFNPKNIKLTQSRNIKELKLPFLGSVIQDLGREKRVIVGNGDFFGKDCMQQFKDLNFLCISGGSGYLSIPGIPPFKAFFNSLVITAQPGPDVLSYAFEFWEDLDIKNIAVANTVPSYHIVTNGETLWDIAEEYNTTAYNLMKLNPDIKRPDPLTPGQRVVLL